MEIVTFLEHEFGLYFSDINFDAALLDSIDLIAELVGANTWPVAKKELAERGGFEPPKPFRVYTRSRRAP